MPAASLQRILYVEDEPDIQEIARLALELTGGFEVEVCDSGQDALGLAESFRPDLILLDVMMPGMDGPATLSALRRTGYGSKIPVIFMTAKVQPQEVEGYRDLGVLDVIPKPFDPMTLTRRIQNIWTNAHA